MSINTIEDVKKWIIDRKISENRSKEVLFKLIDFVYELGTEHGYEDGHTDGYKECLKENSNENTRRRPLNGSEDDEPPF